MARSGLRPFLAVSLVPLLINCTLTAATCQVIRIVPRLNEDVNQEWISDKARFQYDALRYQRLGVPYVKGDKVRGWCRSGVGRPARRVQAGALERGIAPGPHMAAAALVVEYSPLLLPCWASPPALLPACRACSRPPGPRRLRPSRRRRRA